MLKKLKKIKKDLKRYKGYNNSNNTEIKKLQDEKQSLKNELRSSQNKIHETETKKVIVKRTLQNDLVQEKSKVNNILPIVNENYTNETKSEEIIFDIPKINKIFLQSPFDERRFSLEDSNNERNSSALYFINLETSGKEGDLFVLEDADFTKALNSPAQFLEKACSFENAYSNTAVGVENIINGYAVLEGEDWFVKEKIKIKFI